ncbi:MAG: branched-chain amino acid ABC transporter permease [Archaeoglobaceae archaeon]|nr:branched-chain amino acid ABC transporter permease [Archaeoglobaceae archaeon]MCX8151570.1 branched-chain amino acid ABC transporter permease [Archaeoglobaceae archaeon]MDW8013152.1 branched-chain amino acid ABC transporter permease [Archaeoglobaceae archaeon]
MEILFSFALWFGLYAIVALSLNLEYGFAGIPNFGKALAVLVGAISVGGIMNRILAYFYGISEDNVISLSSSVRGIVNDAILSDPVLGIVIFLSSITLASLLGAVAGVIFILPSVKLKQDYLAITLLAISEVVFLVTNYSTEIVGGYYGVSVPDVFTFSGNYRNTFFILVILLFAFLVYFFVERISNSPFGRVLKAMRENEDVLKASGKNIIVLRIKAAAIGSAIASIAGALFSLYSLNVIASSFTRVEWTFYPFLMVLLGGAGNNKGVLAGVAVFVFAKIFLTMFKFEITALLNLPFEAIWFEYMLFGILMFLVLYYKPEGIFKEKPIFTKPIKKVVYKISGAKNN